VIYALITSIALAATVLAQSSMDMGFPAQCFATCSSVITVSTNCANSTGYDFSSQRLKRTSTVFARRRIAPCLTSKTLLLRKLDIRCTQCGGASLGGITDAQQACASGAANLASFTSHFGTEFTGIPTAFTSFGGMSTTAMASGSGAVTATATVCVRINLN
jgi:hypothetical protein